MLIVGKFNHQQALKQAASYEEWSAAALAYDKYKGLDHWREKDETSQYDYISVRIRLDQLRSLISRHDVSGLLYNLNEGIHGNVGGMGKAGLYGHSMSGTKHLISDYIQEVVHALELIDKDTSGEISREEKLDFFRRAGHCFGRTALMMSASGNLHFFHMGVVRALVKQGLLPSVISGSSGGSLAGSLVCTHTDNELLDVLSPEFLLEKFPEEVRNPGDGDRGALLQEALRQIVPDLTFQQAFEKTGRSLNISIASAQKHQTSRLLNAVASPAVLIHSAVRASCAVPGVFSPVTLEALDSRGERKAYLPQRSWVDGAFSDDLPAKRLGRLYGINHTVVSQTNPSSIRMAMRSQGKMNALGLLRQGRHRAGKEWFNTWAAIVDGTKAPEAVKKVTSVVHSLVNQEYVGDVNIIADHKLINPFTLLNSASEKHIRRLFEMGERSAWPKLEMVRQQSRISRKLDALLAQYEQKQVERSHTRHRRTRKAG